MLAAGAWACLEILVRALSARPCLRRAWRAADPPSLHGPGKAHTTRLQVAKWVIAPKRANREPTRGTGFFSGNGEKPIIFFSGRGWGEMPLSKGFLGTIQSNHLAHIPLNPHGGPFPLQNHVLWIPFVSPKRSPAQPEPSRIQMWDSGIQKWVPGSKIPKLRTEKPCRIQ